MPDVLVGIGRLLVAGAALKPEEAEALRSEVERGIAERLRGQDGSPLDPLAARVVEQVLAAVAAAGVR
ncbi:MAG TPA: hypothetical protein VM241_04360 [Candidatus Thermoplasmatota archaeon]|nr:hypothetical protein [Candidatus Thermoplasmatota archaeon]